MRYMSIFDVGRICIKTYGKEIGEKCVIIDVIDKSFVLVTGPKKLSKLKKRRSNVKHLEATETAINIKQGASDEEIISALTDAGKLEEMKVRTKRAS